MASWQAQALEERNRREEEQRRREQAEAVAESSRLQTLQDYLQACHSLSLAIDVVTDHSLTTQGDTTKPAGRLFPRRITPWNSFAIHQENIWIRISTSNDFHSQRVFPSLHQLEYVQSLIAPVSGEIGLRHFERDTVETAVQKLVSAIHDDEYLRNELGLRGTVTFESHTNLGQTSDSVTGLAEETSIGEDNQDNTGMKRSRKDIADNQECIRAGRTKNRRKARGKGNRADQFCIYRISDGRNVPAVAIEYKAPHKLTRDEIVAGLDSEIQPELDVINKEGEGFAFASKSLAAAVITQLFSYMIGKGIQYGYVCTGEVFIFLYIPDNPTVVYYSVSVPNLDFQEDDENGLHRTAVAQVFAFVLSALLSEPPGQSWHDKTLSLGVWEMEYIDVLKTIQTVRKDHSPSPYKPSRWRGFQRSPIRTRSRCQQSGIGVVRDDEGDDDDASPSPSLNRPAHPLTSSVLSAGTTDASTQRGKRRGKSAQGGQREQHTRPNIESRSYCSQKCLLGLARGGALDNDCPNFLDHGREHISQADFLGLIRTQLAQDRESSADCKPLYLSGSRGAAFKVRLSSHGYTLVAKGVENCDRSLLQRENEFYDRLQGIQGTHVPVCLGRTDLVLPYYYDCGVYVCFLFLGWAGQPLLECITKDNAARLKDKAAVAYRALHRLHILHCDAEPRNLVYDVQKDNLMIVDFERAKFHGRQVLQSIDLNQSNRKRKRMEKNLEERGVDEFERELRLVVSCIARYAR